MVEWLLGDEANRPYREQQLTAVASGSFFRMFVDKKSKNFFIRNSSCCRTMF